MTNRFQNPAPSRLTPADFASLAKPYSLTPAHLQAITEVEGKGQGYLPDGRPKILYEAHIFGRLTGHRFDATHPNLSRPTWTLGLYLVGGREYERLQAAM